MPDLIHPQESVLNWTFLGADCLYRDHRGRRVLGDAEGFGHFSVSGTPEGLEVFVDDVPLHGMAGTFSESLLVNALADGPCTVHVTKGRVFPPSGLIEQVGASHQGTGWVVHSSGQFETDEKHTVLGSPCNGFPAPVFFEASAIGPSGSDGLEIIRAEPMRCETMDAFTIDDVAALTARKFVVQNMSKVLSLESSYPNGEPLTSAVASHLNAASWDCPVPSGCRGLLIRKRYDRFHGRQRARVLIDGEAVGWWYEPEEDRVRRWGVAEYGIPAEFVEGKSQVRITIDPPAGAPLWSVSAVKVRALV